MTRVREAYDREVARFAAVYGERTTVAMQQGSMYTFHGEQARVANRVAGLSYNSNDSAGFPQQSLPHWCRRFTDQGYVLVVMDQFTRRKKNGCEEIEREPVAVYGPGTPIDLPFTCDSAVCAVVCLDKSQASVGYATFESNTGKTQACEFVEETFEAAFSGLTGAALADAPAHTVVVYEDSPDGEEAARRFRARAGGSRAFGKRVDYKAVDCVTLRDSHVRETIRSQFDEGGLMTRATDTHAGLGGRRHAARAFSHLVHFVFRCDDAKLRIMEQPTVVSPHSHLDVAIGGLRQLDIVSEQGLLDHLPRCCTGPGRRAFRQRVCRPSRDPAEIERRLEVVDASLPVRKELRRCLKDVKDFESLHRALARPSAFRAGGFVDLVRSMRLLREASEMVSGPRENHPADRVAAAVWEAVDTEASSAAGRTVFHRGVCAELDAASERADAAAAELRLLMEHLDVCSGAAGDPHYRLDAAPPWELTVTERRFEASRRELRRRDRQFEVAGVAVRCSELRLRNHRTKKSVRSVTSPALEEALERAAGASRAAEELSARLHAEHCARIRAETSDDVFLCARELEDLDVASACAVMAEKRGFVRPRVVSGAGAFVDARGLRHPIVESLDDSHEYVGNDVLLDGEARGVLLYGINGSGKSCLMKSVGIAVCMAQAGMYVSASEMSIGPFARLYTRIWNNDDITRGLSTFRVEVVELNQILRNGDSMSLVLGDELCSGTERVSATAIITAGIQELDRQGCRYLLATHQHDVAGMVAGVASLRVRHLAVWEAADGALVYDRRLRPGVGETTYGVTVCRALGMPPSFLERARRALLLLRGEDPDFAVSRRRSNYNPSVYMGACERCGASAAVHTHHREPQATAEPRVKNAAFNLEALCARCHEEHHRAERAAPPRGPVRRVQTTAGPRDVAIDIS